MNAAITFLALVIVVAGSWNNPVQSHEFTCLHTDCLASVASESKDVHVLDLYYHNEQNELHGSVALGDMVQVTMVARVDLYESSASAQLRHFMGHRDVAYSGYRGYFNATVPWVVSASNLKMSQLVNEATFLLQQSYTQTVSDVVTVNMRLHLNASSSFLASTRSK
jgi:hypothetical protein